MFGHRDMSSHWDVYFMSLLHRHNRFIMKLLASLFVRFCVYTDNKFLSHYLFLITTRLKKRKHLPASDVHYVAIFNLDNNRDQCYLDS